MYKKNIFFILIFLLQFSFLYSQVDIGYPYDMDKKYTKKELWDEIEREVFGDFTASAATIKPKGVWSTDYQGVFMAAIDKKWNRLIYANRNDDWFKEFGSYGSGDGEFIHPEAVVIYDPFKNLMQYDGLIYVADTGNKRIVKLQYDFTGKNVTFVESFSTGNYAPHDLAYSNNLTPYDISDDILWVMCKDRIYKLKASPHLENIGTIYGYQDGLDGWNTKYFRDLKAISVIQNRNGDTHNDEFWALDYNHNNEHSRRVSYIYDYYSSPYSTQHYTFPDGIWPIDINTSSDDILQILTRYPTKLYKFVLGTTCPLIIYDIPRSHVFQPTAMENVSGYLPSGVMDDWNFNVTHEYGLTKFTPHVEVKDFKIIIDENYNIKFTGTATSKIIFSGKFSYNSQNIYFSSDSYGYIDYFQYNYGQLPSSWRNKTLNLEITFNSYDNNFDGNPVSSEYWSQNIYYHEKLASPLPVEITTNYFLQDGNYYVENTTTIKNGGTLKLWAGYWGRNINIYLKENAKIIVEQGGKIIGSDHGGTTTFLRYDSDKAWDKIYLKGDNNVFNYCDFDGGKYSLKFYHSSGNSITNCTFNNSYYAIIGSHSNFTVDNCDIQNASTRGVYCTYGTPVVKNSKIYNCKYGIRYYYTSGACEIKSNEISNTQYEGLSISHTSPNIKDNYIHDTGGKGISLNASNSNLEHNSIINCNIGVYSSNNSNYSMYDDAYNKIIMNSQSSASAVKIAGGTPILGYYDKKGKNHIDRGSSTSRCVESLVSGEILAGYNYWGDKDPSSSWFYGNVTWQPYYNDPISDAGSSLGKMMDNTTEDQIMLSNALSFLKKKERNMSVDLFKNLIVKYPDSRYGGMAIAWAMGAYNDMGELESQRDYLQKMQYHKNEKVSDKATLWLESLESFSGNKLAAQKIVNSVAINDPIGIEIRLNFADNLINLYDDAKTADLVFDSIIRSGVSNSVLMVINDIKGDSTKTFDLDKPIYANKEDVKIIPEKYNLSNAYPNPFNPSTTIEYALPYQSTVNVEIDNIMGQKVNKFSYSSQNAGNHKLTWNGQNRYGNKVSSGMYIIRFYAKATDGKAEPFQKIIKAIMLK